MRFATPIVTPMHCIGPGAMCQGTARDPTRLQLHSACSGPPVLGADRAREVASQGALCHSRPTVSLLMSGSSRWDACSCWALKCGATPTWRAQEILTAPCWRERPLLRSCPPPRWSTSVKRWNARTTRPSLVLTTPCGESLSPARAARVWHHKSVSAFCSCPGEKGALTPPQQPAYGLGTFQGIRGMYGGARGGVPGSTQGVFCGALSGARTNECDKEHRVVSGDLAPVLPEHPRTCWGAHEGFV